MPDDTVLRLPASAIRTWASACLRALDMPEADAAQLASDLVQTSLWGVDSHGIARLPHYFDRLTRGSIRARPNIQVTRTAAATAQVHGGDGHGFIVAHRALAEAMQLARESGVGAVGVSDSSHCGAMAVYTRPAARQGLIALAFTHADRIAAPQGGVRAVLGTNPISIAFPRDHGEPVCLDMATTSIPWNRVMNARRENQPIPDGVAITAQGAITTDAHEAAALLPLGSPAFGHKGYALALMIDLLCGPLNGNAWGPDITGMFTELDQARKIGAFFIVIDPQRFAGGPWLAASVSAVATRMASEPGHPLMPGDPELARARERDAQGIPVEPGLLAQMREWSARLGVPSPA
jgi:ureidoglycolate dehydrogenase (NAD+)